MKPIPEDATEIVRSGLERACKDFTARLESLNFTRTKKMLWTRPHSHMVDFIHLHRSGSSYGKPRNYSVNINVNFGIRILNDAFEALSANGPSDDPDRLRAGLYHLRFNAQTGSTYDRCVHDLVRFVLEQGEPWFIRFRELDVLFMAGDSPIREPLIERLRAGVNGRADTEAVAQSLKLLGIKKR